MGFDMLVDLGLEPWILPGAAKVDWNPLSQRLAAREQMNFEASMALILLAMQDPSNTETSRQTDALTDRWRLSNEESRRITTALRFWDTLIDANEKPWSELQPILIQRDIDVAMEVAEAVVHAERTLVSGYRPLSRSVVMGSRTARPTAFVDR